MVRNAKLAKNVVHTPGAPAAVAGSTLCVISRLLDTTLYIPVLQQLEQAIQELEARCKNHEHRRPLVTLLETHQLQTVEVRVRGNQYERAHRRQGESERATRVPTTWSSEPSSANSVTRLAI